MSLSVYLLQFANRAKTIRNEAKINEDLDQKSLLRKYERELKKLRVSWAHPPVSHPLSLTTLPPSSPLCL